MVRNFLEVSVETFVNATEDEDRVVTAVKNLLGRELPEDFEIRYVEGTHGNPIGVLRVSYRRSREVKALINHLRQQSYWKWLVSEAGPRMDESQVLHFRIDKQKALRGEYELWTMGEAIKVKIKIATYPSSREEAIRLFENTADEPI